MIGHVSDTALWVAHYRAVEGSRPDALFQDPLAGRLAGERGRRIAAGMGATSRYTAWTLAIRTRVIDGFIRDLVAAGVDTVLNLGAGLDTRPYRLELPAGLRWIEVDYPGLLDYKESILAGEQPRVRLERVPLDLADVDRRRAFLAGVAATGGTTLVLTEGVIPYLTEPDVAGLAADLRGHPGFRYWIAEYLAREVYEFLNAPYRRARMRNAPFRFFPGDWFGFFRQLGWVPREVTYLGEEALRLGRPMPTPRLGFLYRLLAPREALRRPLRYTGYVVFVPADEGTTAVEAGRSP